MAEPCALPLAKRRPADLTATQEGGSGPIRASYAEAQSVLARKDASSHDREFDPRFGLPSRHQIIGPLPTERLAGAARIERLPHLRRRGLAAGTQREMFASTSRIHNPL
jgi:hypothetical protein